MQKKYMGSKKLEKMQRTKYVCIIIDINMQNTSEAKRTQFQSWVDNRKISKIHDKTTKTQQFAS